MKNTVSTYRYPRKQDDNLLVKPESDREIIKVRCEREKPIYKLRNILFILPDLY